MKATKNSKFLLAQYNLKHYNKIKGDKKLLQMFFTRIKQEGFSKKQFLNYATTKPMEERS